jgi:hypothetical protein
VLYADRSCRSLCTTAQNTPKCGKFYIKTLLKYTFLNTSTGVSWKYRRGFKTHAYSDLGLFWGALNLFKTKKKWKYFSVKCPLFKKENYFLDGFQASRVVSSGKGHVYKKMSMEHWRNDNDRGNPKYSDRKLSHCHFLHRQSLMASTEIEPGSPKWQDFE